MKILEIILTSTLLMSVSVNAMTSKIKSNDKTVYAVLEGDSKGTYMKPGLAVNLSYTSEHVDVGEVLDVNMTITTVLKEGTLKVNLRSLEKDGWDLEEKNLEFKLSKGENSFPINLQLSSENEGQYYLTVFISLEGKGGRIFDIPVKIGTLNRPINTKPIEITDKGIAVTSSNAEEEIK